MPVDRQSRWLLILLLGLAAAFAPVFRNAFVYDDTQLIVQGTLIHDVRNLPALFSEPSMAAFNVYAGGPNPVDTFRPLTIASFMWDAAIAGKSPWSYHLTNLALHLLCVALLWRFARVLLPSAQEKLALLPAAWFGLQRRYDALSTALCLTAILVWRAARGASTARAGRSLHGLVVVLFLLALLSKEVPLLTLPALVLWPERAQDGVSLRRAWTRRVLAIWPFAISTALYLALRLHALQGLRTHRDQSQVLLALSHLPVLLLDGLVQALCPSKIYLRVLSEEYARLSQLELALAAAGAGALALIVFLGRKKLGLLAWGLLWFASVLAPACVVTTLHWPGFGRYLYLPSVGLLVGLTSVLGELWSRLPRLRTWFTVAGALYAALLVWTLERHIATYRSPEKLYRNVIEQRPELAHGYGLLAAHYASQLRHLSEVAELYGLASQRNPDKPEYAKGWADTLFILGRPEQMLRVAEAAERRLGPHPEWELIQARGVIERDPERAIGHLLRCLQLAPGERRCLASLRALARDPAHGARFRELLARKLTEIGPDPRLRSIRDLLP